MRLPWHSLSRRQLLKTVGAGTAGMLLADPDRPVVAAQHAQSSSSAASRAVPPPAIRADDPGTELTLTPVTERTLRLTVAAAGVEIDDIFDDGSLVPRSYPAPLCRMRADLHAEPKDLYWGRYLLRVAAAPLRMSVSGADRSRIQGLAYYPERNQVRFEYGLSPVYGLGPGTKTLDRRGTKDAMHNGAGEDLRTLGARNPIPWLMGRGWGLFFHLPAGQFDLTETTGIWRPADAARALDIFIVLGRTPAELLQEYAELTGYPHLPARWTLGFQQSHRTLESRKQILDEARTFREKRLPLDTMIFLGTGFCPSGWNTGHGSFVFNKGVFPDPAGVVDELHRQHVNVALHVVNPPENLHGSVNDMGTAASTPGEAAHYWARHEPFVHLGIDGWWPDEGDILPTPSRLVRNRMYWEGGRKSRPNRRPFALHRNCYAGIQRWGWLWSGDTTSTWKTLEAQIMEGINAGLNGVPYWGTDIGGFVPTAEFTAELFVRWFQFGAFCPSFRCHGRTWQLRLPWGWNTGSYGPSEMGEDAASLLPQEQDLHNAQVEPICRRFLETRYRLLPYLYSAAWETHTTGLPIIRSLGLAFPEDEKAWKTVDAYLFGPGILVAPVHEKGATSRGLRLPAGGWWNLWTSEHSEGGQEITLNAPLDTMPLMVRAGAIVPTGPVKQYAEEPSSEPVTLTVYPGADGQFTYYDDDGVSFAYEHNDLHKIEMHWDEAQKTLTLAHTKDSRPDPRRFNLKLVGGGERSVTVGPGSQSVRLA